MAGSSSAPVLAWRWLAYLAMHLKALYYIKNIVYYAMCILYYIAFGITYNTIISMLFDIAKQFYTSAKVWFQAACPLEFPMWASMTMYAGS